jgi:hypothetical protein
VAYADDGEQIVPVVDPVEHAPGAHSNAPRGDVVAPELSAAGGPGVSRQLIDRTDHARQHISAEAAEVLSGA